MKKFWKWDPAAQELTLRVGGWAVIVSGDTVAPTESRVMGGFVVGPSGLDATIVWGSDSPQLARLQVIPGSK